MKSKRRFPLMAKVASWLAIHLLALAAAFALFVGWQLRLGLDSLLSGATGERLESLGNEISSSLADTPPEKWDSIISEKISPYGLQGFFRTERDLAPEINETDIPSHIILRAKKELPPPGGGRREPPEMLWHNPRGGPDGPPPNERGRPREEREPRALFLTREQTDGKYWAAIELSIETQGPGRPPRGVLFLKSNNASARGLFFDYSPWLYGGLAVLALSIALWTPFVLGITRYAGRISKATELIADGHFDTKLGASRNDELGRAGESIEEMSSRLGNLISGQKRFLGDVAHELCAPLARIRTGLGILQNKADAQQAERLTSIEEDAEELSTLVSELLAFTKANSSPANPEPIPLAAFCRDLASRELEGHTLEIEIPETLTAKADRKLLTRALRNVLRNCHLHAGSQCTVRISATASGDTVNIVVEDDGPGVPETELTKLFEPFYRTDRSRTRDTGGTGLGMAIVDSSIRACSGKASAEKSTIGGLLVRFILPKN
jgi:two-component system, OmpR family, sensor histidine kinase CpxA